METTREEKTKVYPNGKTQVFILTRAKDVIWLQKEEGVPYLHVRPAKENGWSKVNKFCKGFGMLPMCEIAAPISDLRIEDLWGL
jgi:hypothetical protein